MTKYIIIILAALLFGFTAAYVPLFTDATLTGTGDEDSPLTVDTTNYIATKSDITDERATLTQVLDVGAPGTSEINDVFTDQDFASIYTIPANTITTDKLIKVTIGIQYVTGTSTVTHTHYIKLGSTKIYRSTAANMPDGFTRSLTIEIIIQGTASPGASVNVETITTAYYGNTTAANTVTQPVALATNGDLAITYGTTFSNTGSTETVQFRSYIVESMN